jgi:glycogen debranching enzyme
VKPVVEPGVISLRLRVGAYEERLIRVAVELEESGETVPEGDHALFYAGAPELETDWEPLRKCWARSIEDLESLTFDAGEGLLVPAAGAPWFMALFGRDSLITAYQAMILSPEPARNVLRALARWQASTIDDFTDSEPGKILHELRRGEMAFSGEIPQTPYYGTVDATPLFLILLEELWRWTADDAFVREMEAPARRALAWMLECPHKVEGFAAYATRSGAGLHNQGWKDSDNSMLFRDGAHAHPPIALVEVQGYVYDALNRAAALAAEVWDDAELSEGLRSTARDLRERFDRYFWMEDRGYYALALDSEGRRVDSMTSNPGHLLWSGIVPAEKAGLLKERLMGDELFSGWGIRTMAASEAGYDPNSYHNGSVWPHDNAIIVEGLRRYGFHEESKRIAAALVEAARHFDHRLPEVFGGYPRSGTQGPVEYSTSCSPQAWAAGAVPLLVRNMLGVEPYAGKLQLETAPGPLERVSRLRLSGVPAYGNKHEVQV